MSSASLQPAAVQARPDCRATGLSLSGLCQAELHAVSNLFLKSLKKQYVAIQHTPLFILQETVYVNKVNFSDLSAFTCWFLRKDLEIGSHWHSVDPEAKALPGE